MKKILLVAFIVLSLQFLYSCSQANAKENKNGEAFTEYIVVSEANYAAFQSAVQSHLTTYHYQLAGGICVSNGKYYQAMAK